MSNYVDRFVRIYRDHKWGSSSRSGPGSEVGTTGEYRRTLEAAVAQYKIGSVLDVGCGDWAFSRLVDWGEADYLGIDVVPDMIAALRERYAGPRVRFEYRSGLDEDLPLADLIIMKDVLQHWSNDAVAQMLNKLPRFRFALLTNDCRRVVRRGLRTLFREIEYQTPNTDTSMGGSRPLLLMHSPFSLRATRLLQYEQRVDKYVYTKEVLLWSRDAPGTDGARS